MTEQINFQMEGNTCTVTIPDDSYLRVKLYAPRRQCPVLEGKNTTCAIQLLPGETMRVDAYGEGGEGDLLRTSFLLTEQGLVEQKRTLSRDVAVVVKKAKFNKEQTLRDYEQLQKLITAGAYTERSAEDHLNGTYPEDGVEESLDNLVELAAAHDLEFCWDLGTKTWSLLPMSEETRAARAQVQAYQEDQRLNDGWSDKLAERGY